MWRLLIASAVFSLSVQAAHLDTVCESISSPSFTDGFLTRQNVLENFNGDRLFENHTRLRSVVRQGETLWVLATNAIIEMKKDGTVVQGYELDKNISMTLANELLLVVRSGGAITAFNTKTREVAWTSYMNEVDGGEAVAVAFDGKNALVVMTGTREGGFNGVATMNLQGKVIAQSAYDYRYGVIDPEANARFHNGNLILNNGGWIHVLTAKQLASNKKVKPRWVAHPVGTGQQAHYMMLKGEFFFEGNTLVGCGLYNVFENGDVNRMGGLFKVAL